MFVKRWKITEKDIQYLKVWANSIPGLYFEGTGDENAIYGLRKILLDNFPQNVYIWSAIVNGARMQKIKVGHRAKFWARNKYFLRIVFQVRAILRKI